MKFTFKTTLIGAMFALAGLTLTPSAQAQKMDISFLIGQLGNKITRLAPTSVTPTLQPWMSAEVQNAWNAGYKGQGTTINIVDDFYFGSRFSGQLDSKSQTLRHGEWTAKEASMIAPLATIQTTDFYLGRKLNLNSKGLNVVNASYGMYFVPGSNINWGSLDSVVTKFPSIAPCNGCEQRR